MILNVPSYKSSETSTLGGDRTECSDTSTMFEDYNEDTTTVQYSISSAVMNNLHASTSNNVCTSEDSNNSVLHKPVSKRKSCLPKRRSKMHSEEELVEREVKEYLLKIPSWQKIIPKKTSSSSSSQACSGHVNVINSLKLPAEIQHLPRHEDSGQDSIEFDEFEEKPNIKELDKAFVENQPIDSEQPKIKVSKQKERVFCSMCDKSFGRPSDLRRHAVLHTGEKKHQCDECSKEFSQRYHLVRHIKNVHKKDIKNLFCGLCNETFNSEYLLVRHIKSHGVMTFVCEICSKEFKTKRQMKEHILCSHVGLKPFKCDQCDKAFTRKYHLERHMEMHAGTKNFQCEYCGKEFGTKGNLIAHVKRIHLQIKEFSCGVCKKGFYSSKDLQTHIKVHTGEKPYQCDICLRKFSEKSNMEWHLRIHSGERPYQCDLCNKSYTRLPHLQRHKKEGLCFRKTNKQGDMWDCDTDSTVLQETDSETENQSELSETEDKSELSKSEIQSELSNSKNQSELSITDNQSDQQSGKDNQSDLSE